MNSNLRADGFFFFATRDGVVDGSAERLLELAVIDLVATPAAITAANRTADSRDTNNLNFIIPPIFLLTEIKKAASSTRRIKKDSCCFDAAA